MHTATGLWMTHHGLKRLQRERADLRDWLGRIKLSIQRAITDHKKNREIELILFEKETVKNRLKRVDAVLDQASELPSVWGHKFEARAGIGHLTTRTNARWKTLGKRGMSEHD